MAKRISISDDGGSNYYTFPGNQGSLNDEVGAIDDTIFGQDYSSNQPGMIAETVNCNGFYKGFAGYVAKIYKTGTTTTFTGEAFTLVSGKTYKITNAVKNIWDRAATTVIKDNAVTVSAANIESIDWLYGRVTFASAYTPTGPITADGSYLPKTQVAGANSYKLTQTANALDKSEYVTAQANGGLRSYDYGLKTIGLELGGFFSVTNAYRTVLLARGEAVIEIGPSGDGLAVCRGFFKPSTRNQSGNVGDLEAESINWTLSVPDQANVTWPFKWLIDATATLSTSIQKAITAWQNATKPRIRYQYDGTNGYYGSVVVTEISLSGALDAMNEFSITCAFDGALTPVP